MQHPSGREEEIPPIGAMCRFKLTLAVTMSSSTGHLEKWTGTRRSQIYMYYLTQRNQFFYIIQSLIFSLYIVLFAHVSFFLNNHLPPKKTKRSVLSLVEANANQIQTSSTTTQHRGRSCEEHS